MCCEVVCCEVVCCEVVCCEVVCCEVVCCEVVCCEVACCEVVCCEVVCCEVVCCEVVCCEVVCCVPTLLTFWMPWLPSGLTGDMFCKAEQSAISMATKSSKIALNLILLTSSSVAKTACRSAGWLFILLVSC